MKGLAGWSRRSDLWPIPSCYSPWMQLRSASRTRGQHCDSTDLSTRPSPCNACKVPDTRLVFEQTWFVRPLRTHNARAP